MSNMPWFRVYSEILHDNKIRRICRKTGHAKALVLGFWVCMLSLASESPSRGTLSISEDIPLTVEDLEDETGLPREIIAQLIDEFKAEKVSGWTGHISFSLPQNCGLLPACRGGAFRWWSRGRPSSTYQGWWSHRLYCGRYDSLLH